MACHYSEQPSTTAVQAYVLIAMYLHTAARRDAAFMYTGVATRAAYALGLHRGDIAHSFPAEQQIIRQRLWKVVIVLDGYVSTILGRKPASTQPCGAIINNHYSSCLALFQIFSRDLARDLLRKTRFERCVAKNQRSPARMDHSPSRGPRERWNSVD